MINERTGLDAEDVIHHQCAVCRHLRKARRVARCKAFPDGIPPDIIDNSFDHREPHEGDHGIQFRAKPGREYPPNLRAAVALAAELDARHRAWLASEKAADRDW